MKKILVSLGVLALSLSPVAFASVAPTTGTVATEFTFDCSLSFPTAYYDVYAPDGLDSSTGSGLSGISAQCDSDPSVVTATGAPTGTYHYLVYPAIDVGCTTGVYSNDVACVTVLQDTTFTITAPVTGYQGIFTGTANSASLLEDGGISATATLAGVSPFVTLAIGLVLAFILVPFVIGIVKGSNRRKREEAEEYLRISKK